MTHEILGKQIQGSALLDDLVCISNIHDTLVKVLETGKCHPEIQKKVFQKIVRFVLCCLELPVRESKRSAVGQVHADEIACSSVNIGLTSVIHSPPVSISDMIGTPSVPNMFCLFCFSFALFCWRT